ncbi:hydroxymethylglutaryl-CoA lyase [Neobacillus cucumis]|uniref:hydroxymethylglutaryl-CoA lyase n=1 Tax=Neobacillus cucumis TaxID=1740721 RepID=UPI001E305AD7|nr:hydroxymethylglutaryl-CoA lyase [Neobacillus cucumis]
MINKFREKKVISLNLPQFVEIVEVGPRDGLQNEAAFIPTEKKIGLIEALNNTGIKRMEATSFVHPVHVPQMKDSYEVFTNMNHEDHVQYMVLIPNEKGYERAIHAGANDFTLVAGASNEFNLKNVRITRDESMAQLENVIGRIKENRGYIRFDIATSFWCPFEGKVNEGIILGMVDQLEKWQVDEIVLCDTIGRATPKEVYQLFSKVLDKSPSAKIAAHFHDTYGFAQSNVLAALQAGVTVFDSSIGGLGGCPFAPGAAGNSSTEDLVMMLQEMDIDTGVDLNKLLQCVDLIKTMTQRELSGHLNKINHPINV